MTTHETQDLVAAGVARRTLLGAAWSAPVIAVAVAAPFAAASPGGVTATLAWVDPPGVQKESSLLLLTLQPATAGSPVVRGTGTLTFTVLEDYAYAPAQSVSPPPGWNIITDHGRTLMVVAPDGVTAGSKGFNVTWGELSGNWTATATWTESDATGSVAASIVVGPRGFPALDWITNPAVFGGTSTLRLTVPADSYAIGYSAFIFLTPELPADSVIDLPAGWTLSPDTIQNSRYLVGPPTAAGTFDFGVTLGSGSAEVSVRPMWIASGAPGATPIYPSVPLTITPA